MSAEPWVASAAVASMCALCVARVSWGCVELLNQLKRLKNYEHSKPPRPIGPPRTR